MLHAVSVPHSAALRRVHSFVCSTEYNRGRSVVLHSDKMYALDEKRKKVISHSYWCCHLVQEVMTSGCCVMLLRNTSHTQLPCITHTAHTVLPDSFQIFASLCQVKVSPPAPETSCFKHLDRYGLQLYIDISDVD